MINTYRIRVVCTVLLFLLSLFFSAPVAASTVSYKITDGFTGYFPDFWVNGFGFFSKDIYFNYTSGNVILSANPDGTGDMHVADTLKVYHAGNTIFAFDAHHPLCLDKNLKPLPPVDISSFYEFGIGFNRVLVALYRWCGGNKSIGPMYLVNTKAPPITPRFITSKILLSIIAEVSKKNDFSKNFFLELIFLLVLLGISRGNL